MNAYDRELEWMFQYGVRRSRARPCLAFVARRYCARFRIDKGSCPFCVGWGFDHTNVYLTAEGARLFVTQPYNVYDDKLDALREFIAPLGLHLVAHPPGAAWWHPRTWMLVVSDAPIPAHGYRYEEKK